MTPIEYYRISNTANIAQLNQNAVCQSINKLFESFIQQDGCMVNIFYDTDLDGVSSSGLFLNYLKKKIEESNPGNLEEFHVSCQATPHGAGVKDILEAGFKRCAGINNVITVVLDHALTAELNQLIQNAGKLVVWIDHHAIHGDFEIDETKLYPLLADTAANDHSTLGMVFRLYNELAIAKSEKAEDKANHEVLTNCVAVVEHYDTGKAFVDKNNPLSSLAKGLNEFFYQSGSYSPTRSYPMEMLAIANFFNPYETFSEENFHIYIAEGRRILDVKETIVDNVVAASTVIKTVQFPNTEELIKIGLIFHSDSRNELAEAILDTYDDVSLAVVVMLETRDAVNYAKVSLRARHVSGIDAGKIATVYGGGGHRHAAGFYLELKDMASNPIFS